ncbi:MAG: hypothetical protein LBF58_12920 [Deltaproteobacteria bacterium]|jgi:hypothetical protein|nr:hypothetical protein [Deltaproteobacteria bacterium]
MGLLKPVVISLTVMGVFALISLIFTISARADSPTGQSPTEGAILVAQGDYADETEENCPESEGPADPVEGAFVSTDCGDFCHLFLKLDNGQVVDFLGGEEETQGLRPGTRIRLTLKKIQSWSPEPPACVRGDLVLKVERVR